MNRIEWDWRLDRPKKGQKPPKPMTIVREWIDQCRAKIKRACPEKAPVPCIDISKVEVDQENRKKFMDKYFRECKIKRKMKRVLRGIKLRPIKGKIIF